MDLYICKLCNNEYKSRMSLMNHIIRTHHYTGKQYYDEFFKRENEGVCENCSKPTKFLNIDDGYAKCCCIKCAMPGRAKRNLDKYGYADNFHNPEMHKKARSKEANQKREQTMLDRYGCKSYLETDTVRQQAKEFYKEKYNKDYYTQTDEYKEKVKKTNQEKYNVDYVLQSNEIKEKSKQSKLIKYGDPNYRNRAKAEQTTLKRYGVKNILTLPEVQEKAQRNSHTPEAVAKIHVNRNYRKIAIATAKTKKANGNKSTNELEFENLCKLNNIKYIEEYSDERYPFPCDFYLPDLDCFVELHCSWVHRDHIYNEEEDKLLLTEWQEKAKSSNYYKSAIKTWTIKDVNKLNIAKQNKLNYIILWNMNDIQLWFAMNCPKCIKYETYTWIEHRTISNKLTFPNKLTDGTTKKTKIAKVAQFNEFYDRLVSNGISQEDARFILPNACDTKIIVTMDVRSLYNFFQHRCCNRAQWEIRALAWKMLKLCREVAPVLFENAGPDCFTKKCCGEGAMSCHKPYYQTDDEPDKYFSDYDIDSKEGY